MYIYIYIYCIYIYTVYMLTVYMLTVNYKFNRIHEKNEKRKFFYLFFFHEHSRFTGRQGKKVNSLTPLYHFHPFHIQLDVGRAITAENSPLHIARNRN